MQGDVFIWIEVLSSVNTPRLKDFTTRVADAWLAIKLKVTTTQYAKQLALFITAEIPHSDFKSFASEPWLQSEGFLWGRIEFWYYCSQGAVYTNFSITKWCSFVSCNTKPSLPNNRILKHSRPRYARGL